MIYVGQTKVGFKRRKAQHLAAARLSKEKRTYFGRALAKHGENSFEWTILVDDIQTLNEANVIEKYWVAKLGTYTVGYNLTTGGDGVAGHICSEQQKQILRSKNTGRKHTEEEKRRISIANKGKKRTDETKRKLSLIRTGKIASDIAKIHMSESGKGKVKSSDHRRKIGEAHIGMKRNASTRKNISNAAKKRRTASLIEFIEMINQIFVEVIIMSFV